MHHDRPDDDRFAAWLGASCGLGVEAQGPRALPESARLFQAGLLGARSRHPEGLTKLLANHFRVPVRIEFAPIENVHDLRAGMSVTVDIDTGRQNTLLALLGLSSKAAEPRR